MISRRLPGFAFEVQAPPVDDSLPRMDIAAFVGFAASGPLHIPVAIESAEQFAMIFGEDAPLGWDAQKGVQHYAYLAPTVRAFFRNGGVRCWVIRVADADIAVTNQFPISGLLSVTENSISGEKTIHPALMNARSPGSWSDSLRVSAVVVSRSLPIIELTETQLILPESAANHIRVGDVLRIKDDALDSIVFFAIRAIQHRETGSPPIPTLQVTGTSVTFESVAMSSPPLSIDDVYATDGSLLTHLSELHIDDNHLASIDLQSSLDSAPSIGSWLRLNLEDESIWLRVENVRDIDITGSPAVDAVRISGTARRYVDSPSNISLWANPEVECLRMTLTAEATNGETLRLNDLSFAVGTRYWWDLPDDATLYQSMLDDRSLSDFDNEAITPRFPLAGIDDNVTFSVPLLLATVPEYKTQATLSDNTPLDRDGLTTFHAGLFIDDALADVYTSRIMNRADFIQYQSLNERDLIGIHAALRLHEVTLIAVPDAAQPGWHPINSEAADAPLAQDPLARPEWWRWHPDFCALDENNVPRTEEPQWENFINCDIELLNPPTLSASPVNAAGTFTVFWDATQDDVTYIVEEATLPDFSDAILLYEGTDQSMTLFGRSTGTYYYHARIVIDNNTSNWSNGIVVQIQPNASWQMNVDDEDAVRTLIDVQRALLRMCAGRGDMFAILNLPSHYRADDAMDHTLALRPGGSSHHPLAITPPLSFGENASLSFGAVYHPWLVVQDLTLRSTPPDGAMSGVFAKRALERGAWIAPANDILPDVVALEPSIEATNWLAIQNAQINLIRNEPYGFVVLNADTLIDEELLRPLNVRRLLSLIRRLAIQLGTDYVFEPFDGVFRRMVERAFERRLTTLFERGAFRGRTSTEAYQVQVISTPNDVDNGRFIVEIKIAPSLPLTFVIVRLVQSGDRSEVIEEITRV